MSFTAKIPVGQLDPIQQLLHYGLSIENARLFRLLYAGQYHGERFGLFHVSWRAAQDGGDEAAAGRESECWKCITRPMAKETLDKTSVAIRFAKNKPETVLESWFPFRKRLDMVIPFEHRRTHSLQDRYHFGTHTHGKADLAVWDAPAFA